HTGPLPATGYLPAALRVRSAYKPGKAMQSYGCVSAGRPCFTIFCMADWWDGFEPAFEGPITLYAQVANFIENCVGTGSLKHGAKLPAERELAGHLGVSYDTMRRATAL